MLIYSKEKGRLDFRTVNSGYSQKYKTEEGNFRRFSIAAVTSYLLVRSEKRNPLERLSADSEVKAEAFQVFPLMAIQAGHEGGNTHFKSYRLLLDFPF